MTISYPMILMSRRASIGVYGSFDIYIPGLYMNHPAKVSLIVFCYGVAKYDGRFFILAKERRVLNFLDRHCRNVFCKKHKLKEDVLMKRVLSFILCFVLVALMLGACSSAKKEVQSGTASEGGNPAGDDKELNLFIWSEYIPQSVLDTFKEKYGVEVKLATYASNEEMLAKLMAGGASQYDMVVPSNYVVHTMVQQNLLQTINHDSIPNLKNIDPNMLGKDFDKENKYTVPYMVSFTLLAVNKKTCPVEIKSYNDLLNPALKDSMVVVDDPRELIGIALQALGYSFNETDAAKLEEAKRWLLKLTPNIKAYDGDSPKTKLISGETSVGFVWSGEAALAMAENPDIQVVWPKEGINMAIDNLAITSGAKHKKAAELFIDYILDPQTSKLISDEYPYTNPNKEAQKLLSKDYMDNPASNVPEEEVKKATLTEEAGEAMEAFDKIWSEIKTVQ